jgi:nucleoside-diphosphate-sugar epimerase
MKLIITGASGFVATEVIRRSLSLPQITSVIAIARRPVSAPDNLYPEADPSKLHSAVVKDYDEYPGDVKKQFADADACIWYCAFHPLLWGLFYPEFC